MGVAARAGEIVVGLGKGVAQSVLHPIESSTELAERVKELGVNMVETLGVKTPEWVNTCASSVLYLPLSLI